MKWSLRQLGIYDSSSAVPVGVRHGRFGLWIRLLAVARPYLLWLNFAFMLSALSISASLALPLGLRVLMNTLLYSRDLHTLTMVSVVLLGMYAAKGILNFMSSWILGNLGSKIVAELRLQLYSRLQRTSLSFLTEQKLGDLTSRLSADTGKLRTALTSTLSNGVVQTLRLCGCVVIMLVLNWRLAIIAVLTTPAATLASHLFGQTLRKASRNMQDCLAASTATAQESLVFTRTVKAFVREDIEDSRYRVILERWYQVARTVVTNAAFFSSTVDFLFVLATIMLFWVGGHEVMTGNLRGGDLVAFIFYSQTITSCIGDLSRIYIEITAATGATSRVFELMEIPTEGRHGENLPAVTGSIELNDVWFSYKLGQTIIRGIDLRIPAGSFVAIVGPSGCGKSTLLSLIARMYNLDRGRICLDGIDVATFDLYEYRQKISLAPQDPEIFAATIEENIRYGWLEASVADVEYAALRASAHGFIMELPQGYQTRVGERGTGLSVGQKQRISIARALLKAAPILLLDEPTSSLDGESEIAVVQSLLELRKGCTTVVVAHNLSTVVRADVIVVMSGGQVVEIGPHEQLVSAGGMYARLFQAHIQMATEPSADIISEVKYANLI